MKMSWWVKFLVKVATLFLPEPWRGYVKDILGAYESMPPEKAEACHEGVCAIIDIHSGEKREGVGSGPNTVGGYIRWDVVVEILKCALIVACLLIGKKAVVEISELKQTVGVSLASPGSLPNTRSDHGPK